MKPSEVIPQANSTGSRILKAREGPSSETIAFSESLYHGSKVVVPFCLEKPIVGMLMFGQVEANTKATMSKMLVPTNQVRF